MTEISAHLWDSVASEELSAVKLHEALAPQQHTWRTRETLTCLEHFRRAHDLLSLKGAAATDKTRVQGLAALLLGYYHGWGYALMDGWADDAPMLVPIAGDAIHHLTRAATPIPHPTKPGVMLRQMAMEPGHYALTRAMEIVLQGLMATMPEDITGQQQEVVESCQRLTQALLVRLNEQVQGLQPPGTWGEVADEQLQAEFGFTTVHVRTVLLWSNMMVCKFALRMGIPSLDRASRSTMVTTAQQLLALQPSSPMALFFVAESLHLRDGLTEQAVGAMKRTVQASEVQGDEVYGALSAWYAMSMLVCGNKPYSKLEVDRLMAKAEAWKVQLKRCGTWPTGISCRRCKMLMEPVKKHFKAALKQAKVSAASTEDVILQPYTGQVDYNHKLPEAHECAGCKKYFHVTLLCSACRQVRYCSKLCQDKHRPQHKAACKAASSARAARSTGTAARNTSATTSQPQQQGQQASHASSSSSNSSSRSTNKSAAEQAPAVGAGAVDAASAAAMSVRELKAALAALGLSSAGCVERGELVALLLGNQGSSAK